MENYCDNCELSEKCVFAYGVNFCEECKDAYTCTIRDVMCNANHDIECNNGFIDKDDYCDFGGVE